jgi:hypothetical protein
MRANHHRISSQKQGKVVLRWQASGFARIAPETEPGKSAP